MAPRPWHPQGRHPCGIFLATCHPRCDLLLSLAFIMMITTKSNQKKMSDYSFELSSYSLQGGVKCNWVYFFSASHYYITKYCYSTRKYYVECYERMRSCMKTQGRRSGVGAISPQPHQIFKNLHASSSSKSLGLLQVTEKFEIFSYTALLLF